MSKRTAVISFFILLVLFVPQHVSAHERLQQEVLGDATQAAQVSFQNVTAGPGIILPTSPLFFIDKMYQQFKLAFATSPEAKAKVRAEIIGERMAEVKAMILKNNEKGLEKALQNLTDESDNAAEDLNKQAQAGKNVEEAAKTLNESLKQEHTVLTSLADNSTGSMEFTFKSAREKVKLHKIEVEDRLPNELLQNEIENGIKAEIGSQASEAAHTTLKLKRSILELQKRASDAAMKEQQKRLEAIKKAIAKQNAQQKKRYEELLKLEKKKQEELKKKQEELRKKAEEAAKAASEVEKQVTKDDYTPVYSNDEGKDIEDTTEESSNSGETN